MDKKNIMFYFILKIIQAQLPLKFYLLTKKANLPLFSYNNRLKHLFFDLFDSIWFNFDNIICKNYLKSNTKINKSNLVIKIHQICIIKFAQNV